MSELESFLHLLKANPTLLDPAPAHRVDSDIIQRTKEEIHSCLHCGERAEYALVARTKIGLRWLDLCETCAYWVSPVLTR